MINKKGALIHWILFGIIGAIGLFLYYVNAFVPSSGTIGSWQLDVVNGFLHQSEVDLMTLDISARDTGWRALSQLGSQGGFLGPSPCGTEQGVNRWNVVDRWCLPEETKNMKTLFFLLFPHPGKIIFSHLTIDGERIMASGGKRVLKSTNFYLREYTYDYSFDANLHYSFDEYAQLAAEARKMVDTCRKENELQKCLTAVKPVYWYYTSCDLQVVPQGTRIWSFCVKSPNNAMANGKVVEYNLALDFT